MKRRKKKFTKTSAREALNPDAEERALLDMIGCACRALRARGNTWAAIERKLHLARHNGITAYNLAKRVA